MKIGIRIYAPVKFFVEYVQGQGYLEQYHCTTWVEVKHMQSDATIDSRYHESVNVLRSSTMVRVPMMMHMKFTQAKNFGSSATAIAKAISVRGAYNRCEYDIVVKSYHRPLDTVRQYTQ